MQKNNQIVVTSKTFSKNMFLKEALLEIYPKTRFNDEGKKFSPNELKEFLQGADGAIIALETINEEILQALPQLKVISKYGVGLDNLDLQAMKNFGVQLGWKGGVNCRSVSELVLFFAIGQMRESFDQVLAMKNLSWAPTQGRNLSQKTFGIIGMGHVGQDLLKLLQPFDCKILFNDILDKSEIQKKFNAKQVSLDEVLAQSDLISLHVPKTPQTFRLISEPQFEVMKPGSTLINTSRGGVVDESALLKAMTSKKIRACFDVFEEEPTANQALLQHPHFFSTPHTGGTTEESVRLMGLAAIEGLSEHYDPT